VPSDVAGVPAAPWAGRPGSPATRVPRPSRCRASSHYPTVRWTHTASIGADLYTRCLPAGLTPEERRRGSSITSAGTAPRCEPPCPTWCASPPLRPAHRRDLRSRWMNLDLDGIPVVSAEQHTPRSGDGDPQEHLPGQGQGPCDPRRAGGM